MEAQVLYCHKHRPKGQGKTSCGISVEEVYHFCSSNGERLLKADFLVKPRETTNTDITG